MTTSNWEKSFKRNAYYFKNFNEISKARMTKINQRRDGRNHQY